MKQANKEKISTAVQLAQGFKGRGISAAEAAVRLIGFFLARAVPYGGIAPFGLAYITMERRFGLGAVVSCAAAAAGYASLLDFRLGLRYICCTLAYLLFLFAAGDRDEDIPMAAAVGAAASAEVLAGIAEMMIYGFSVAAAFGCIVGAMLTAVGGVVFEKTSQILSGRRSVLLSMNREEKMCLGIMCAVMLLGLKGLRIGEFISAADIAGLWLIGMFAASGGVGCGAVCGICVGLICGGGDAMYKMSVCAVCGIAGGLVYRHGRNSVGLLTAAAAAAGAVYCAAAGYTLFGWADIPLSAIFIIMTPETVPRTLKRIMGIDSGKGDAQRCREYIRGRLDTAAGSFRNLAETFFSLSDNEEGPDAEEISMLFDSVAERVCRECPAIGDCWVQHFNRTYNGLFKMLKHMECHGTLAEEEAESCLGRRCLRGRSLTREMNALHEIYRINCVWRSKLSENRELAAQQIAGVAQILDGISDELCEERIDSNAEQEIRMRLVSKGLEITELDVTMDGRDGYFAYVGAVVEDNPDTQRRSIETTLRAVLGVRMTMVGAVRTDGGELMMRFARPQGYAVEAGSASGGAGEENGDSCVMRYLSEGKYAAALSDGMGTGHRASRDSAATVRILGDFLEAGFDRELAVRLVNSIMVMKSANEAFATVDICVIDLFGGEAEFIKNGAEPSYIKRGGEIETVKGASLPVGVVRDVEIETFAHKLNIGDIVVMLSDGMRKKDGSEEWIKTMIAEADEDMPAQELADRIMDMSKILHGNELADDMTVMVMKLCRGR